MNIRCIPLHPPKIFLQKLHKSPPVLRIFASTIPPTDRILDFGKHKGKMLGTLPSTYLKWISNNLRTQDFEQWAKLADQVLEDPVYRDRIEWEFADRLMTGTGEISSDGNAVSQLVELSEKFGWDYDDKIGWSRINFGLLGTSKGGRIPRVSEKKRESESKEVRQKRGFRVLSEGRRRRRERVKSKVLVSEPPLDRVEETAAAGDEIKEDRTAEIRSRFPGRQSLLEKALSRRRM